MIKHGRIYPFTGRGGMKTSHLSPIRQHVTRGMADSMQDIVIKPQACDVIGAKKFNGQQCVIAKCLTRSLHPQAVAIGRAVAYAVFDGLAIRFGVPSDSRKVVEEFDSRGRVRRADIKLCKVSPSWRFRSDKRSRVNKKPPPYTIRSRAKRIGVRAVGGGVT